MALLCPACLIIVSRQGTDFECRSKSTHYICNETRAENALQNLFGKHEDETCNEYNEQCRGECFPGFVKCLINDRPSCADPEKYVKCGEECKKSSKFYECNGTCIATTEIAKENVSEALIIPA